MARVTKVIAEEVSNQVIAPFNEQIAQIQKEITEHVEKIYVDSVPKEVMECFKKHVHFFKTISTLYVKGVGIPFTAYGVRENLFNKSPYTDNTIILTGKSLDKYLNLYNKKEDLIKKRNTTKLEIKSLLLALGTYKRIQEQLPLIYPLLPEVKGGALMVIPEKTKATINCLLSLDKDKKCMEKI